MVYNSLVLNIPVTSKEHISSNSSTSSSADTYVKAPRCVKERLGPVAEQLCEQHKLAQKGALGATLTEATEVALSKGIVGGKEAARLREVNKQANIAKHQNFSRSTSSSSSEWKK
mmetsp:Transcript_8441/g.13698  ORF Transcript_8441/g.13698 Transcript_8441/m.13698 type:complete len:115 (+) Transcript_8441:2-346(+)